MDGKRMLDFLRELAAHNDLDWMHAHQKEYKAARADFVELTGMLLAACAAFDPTLAGLAPEKLVARLNRDTRFSRDKSPYTPAFRAHLSAAGHAPVPVGYYVCVKPGASFLGGGLYAAMLPGATVRVREKIASEGARWETIVHSPDFPFTILGERLKNVPRGYDAAHPQAEWLKLKSFYLEDPVSDEALCDPVRFTADAAARYHKMTPLHTFLNEAMEGFEMPKRPGK